MDLPELEFGSYRARVLRIRNGKVVGCDERVCRCWPGARHALRRLESGNSNRPFLLKIAEMLSFNVNDYRYIDDLELEVRIDNALDRSHFTLCITQPFWDVMYPCVGSASQPQEDLSVLQKHKLPRNDLKVYTQLPQSKPAEQTWIEFQLLNDKTEEPLAGVPFTIELPGGSIVTKSTDAEGVLRIDGVPPGVCDIKQISDPRGLAVIRVE